MRERSRRTAITGCTWNGVSRPAPETAVCFCTSIRRIKSGRFASRRNYFPAMRVKSAATAAQKQMARRPGIRILFRANSRVPRNRSANGILTTSFAAATPSPFASTACYKTKSLEHQPLPARLDCRPKASPWNSAIWKLSHYAQSCEGLTPRRTSRRWKRKPTETPTPGTLKLTGSFCCSNPEFP